MVNFKWPTVVTAFACSSILFAQVSPGFERRLADLENKMRQIDPAFRPSTAMETLEARLSKLEGLFSAILSKPQPAVQMSAMTALVAQAVPAPAAPPPSANEETRLPVAGYMDFHVNKDRGEPFRPDFHRFVLLFGHSFSNRIKFWSELEVEHALVEGGEPKGEVALEQAYLDFLIKPYFNLRAGMLLTPVGITNERHEPPAFNGVERPFVETFIIPTTWRELGFGATGTFGKGFRYRAYLTSALDATRFSAEMGIAEGRTSGFDASFRNPAKVARLEFAGVRRLTLGTSIYSGHTGFRLEGLNPRVTIFDADGRYSWKRFDGRALFANTWISQAGQLNQNLRQTFGRSPNLGSQMRGYYFEPAVHLMPTKLRHDLIFFTRYEKYNTQQEMPTGFRALPVFNRSAWVTGLTYKPHADVAIKFDYIFNRNASSVLKPADGINLGIGWWF